MKQFKLINKIFLFSISMLAITVGVLLFLNNKDAELSNVVTHKLSTTAKLASEVAVDNTDGYKALAAGIGIGLAALGGTIAMGLAVAKASESISRQPEADGKIRSAFMLGLVFIETVVIYALIVGILIIFVL